MQLLLATLEIGFSFASIYKYIYIYMYSLIYRLCPLIKGEETEANKMALCLLCKSQLNEWQ